jgi:hypothetical protein
MKSKPVELITANIRFLTVLCAASGLLGLARRVWTGHALFGRSCGPTERLTEWSSPPQKKRVAAASEQPCGMGWQGL